MKFHEFVISRRRKFNLNREQFAKKARISDRHLQWLEDGTHIPHEQEILQQIADALYVDREWFLSFADIKSKFFT